MWKINYHGLVTNEKYWTMRYAPISVYHIINQLGATENLEFDSVELVLEE